MQLLTCFANFTFFLHAFLTLLTAQPLKYVVNFHCITLPEWLSLSNVVVRVNYKVAYVGYYCPQFHRLKLKSCEKNITR